MRILQPLKITFILFSLLWGVVLTAQDAFYSQYYSAPLFLNPALTGHIEGSYRLGLAYRSQWKNKHTGGYETPSATLEYSLEEYGNGSSAAFGLAFMNDKVGGGKIRSNTVLFSSAYHLGFDKKGKNYLSLGIQGGFLSTSLEQNLQFESNIFGSGSDVIANIRANNPDVRVGAVWSTFLTPEKYIRFGIGYAHINEITQTFIRENSTVEQKIAVHGDLALPTRKGITYKPSFLIMVQGASRFIMFGGLVEYDLNEFNKLIGGLQYRVGDATTIYGGVHLNKKTRVVVSYDFHMGWLGASQSFRGGSYELSVAFTDIFSRTREAIDPAKLPDLGK